MKIEPVQEDGKWKCPVCGFEAMSKTVVENHIKTSHKDLLKEKKMKNKENDKKKKKSRRREIVEELYHDYVFELLHNKEAEIYVDMGGKVVKYRGKVHARDPYTILLDTEDGERIILSKGYIIAYVPLKEQ